MIRKVHLQNVAGIAEFANQESFPGVTVILGKNDVCKTSLLKMLYVLEKSSELYSRKAVHESGISASGVTAEKMRGVYGRNKVDLGDIVRKNGSIKRLYAHAEFEDSPWESVDFSFGSDSKGQIKDFHCNLADLNDAHNVIFIPSKEVITAFAAIKAVVRQYFFPGYDDTTLDLIDMLDMPEVNETRIENSEILETIASMFSGELKRVQNSDNFVFKKGNSEFSLQMTAEGVKHIGVIANLIRNGLIHKGTVLMLDEPEDNLHPFAIRQLVKVLMALGKAGVQIFMTTHNYFAIKQLQIESRKEGAAGVMCCSMTRGDDGNIRSSFSDLKDVMPENDIVSESLAMYDEEIESQME